MFPKIPTQRLALSTLLWLILLLDVVLTRDETSNIFDRHDGCRKHKHIQGQCRHKFWKLNQCKPERSNKKTKGISKDLLDQFRLMSQYSAAAYRSANTNSTDTLISCSDQICKYNFSDPCPLVEAAKAKTAIEFEDTPHFDDHGMMTELSSQKHC